MFKCAALQATNQRWRRVWSDFGWRGNRSELTPRCRRHREWPSGREGSSAHRRILRKLRMRPVIVRKHVRARKAQGSLMLSRLRNREAVLTSVAGWQYCFSKAFRVPTFCPLREFFATLSVSLCVVKCVVSKPSILFGTANCPGGTTQHLISAT